MAEGRDLLAGGDAGAAVTCLRDALALWRGDPLTGVASLDLLDGEVRRLQELRLLAVMERIDADLALGHDAELIGEIQRLVDSHPLQERLRAQLMLALYRSGRQAESLAVYRDASAVLREELGLEPGPALRELERMVLRQDEQLGTAPGPPAPLDGPGSVVCRFKGLAFFYVSDAEYFCGGERLVSDLVARLAEWTLVGILGPSGIGKSSLLRAGLLPALRSGVLPGSSRWRQVLLRPGEHPCEELARVLGEGGLDGVLGRLEPGERIVIAIDQLEELFTVCEQEPERAAFLKRLAAAANDHERRVFVVCALRADFYGRLGSYPAFAKLLSQSHALVGPMDREELMQAVQQPAARAGLAIERALVDALVSDVVDEPGGLPLLSTSLLELWRGQQGQTLRFESYRRTGGVRGAVSRLAEATYLQLAEPQRRVAARVLLRLAGEEDGALVRRRVPAVQLQRVDGADRVLAALTDSRLLTVSEGAVELSHEALLREWPRYRAWLEEDRVGRRLHSHLTAAAGEWDLRARDPGDLYRGARLAAAIDWTAQHRDQLTGLEREFIDCSQLEAEREARRQRSQNRRLRGLLIGTGVLLFISVLAGIAALVKQRDATHDARLAATEARAALGRQLGTEAVSEPRIDIAMLLAREAVALDRSPQTEGTLLSTLLRSPAVTGTFALPTDSAPRVALSPDGRTLAVSDGDTGAVRFYDTFTHLTRPLPLTDFSGNQPPVYSSDGSLLAYPAGAVLKVRNAHTLSLVARLPLDPGFDPQVTGQPSNPSILISPDRRTVYDAYWLVDAGGHPAGSYIDRWSLPSGRRLGRTRVSTAELLALRLVDRGTRLVVATTQGVSTYDAPSLRLRHANAIVPRPRIPSAGAISPDGGTVAIGSRTGELSFADVHSGRARRGNGTQGAAVAGLVYSPDGATVVSFGDDNRVVTWDSRRAAPVTVSRGPLGQVQNAAIGAAGKTLYTASLDGVVLAWDLTGDSRFGRRLRLSHAIPCCDPVSPRAPALAVSGDGATFAVRLTPSTVGVFFTPSMRRRAVFTIRGGVVTALALSPDGSRIAVAGHAGVVQLWAVAGAPRLVRSLTGLRSLSGLPEAIQAVAFSPDGKLVAASDDSETLSVHETAALPLATLAIWRADTGTLVAPPRQLGAGNGPGGSDVLAFSRDGQLLAVSRLHGGVLVLDARTARPQQRLPDPGQDVISLAFAPDGALATGSLAGTVEIWNPISGRRLTPPLLAESAPVAGIAFDPTGRRFASSGYQDGTVKLWLTATLQPEGPDLTTDPNTTSAISFDPAGGGLLAVDEVGNAFTWPMSLAAWEHHACAVAARNLTRSEWTRFVPELPYTTVCP